MADQSVYIRLVVRDGDTTQRILERTGTAGAAAFNRLGDASRRAATDTNLFTDKMARLGTGATSLRGNLSNIGFQVQDLAVQIGSGTNAVVALTQQLPQLAGGFGPVGAAIGAVVAVGGALALAFGGLGSKAKDAELAVKAFDAAQAAAKDTAGGSIATIAELATKYAGMSDSLRELEARDISRAIRKNQDALADQRKELLAAVAPLEQYRQTLERVDPVTGQAPEFDPNLADIYDAADKLRSGQGDVAALSNQIADLVKKLPQADTALVSLSDSLIDPAKRAQELSETAARLKEQLAALSGEATRASANPVPGTRADLDAVEKRNEAIAAGIRLEAQALEQGKGNAERQVAELHREADEQRKLDAEKARAAQAAIDNADREAKARKAAADAAAEQYRRADTQVDREAAYQHELADAYRGVGVSVRDVEEAYRARQVVQQAGVDLDSQEGKALYDKSIALERQRDAVKDLEKAEQDRVDAAKRAEADLARSQQQSRDRAVRAAEDAAREQARIIQEPVLQAARNIQDSLGNAIYDGLNGSLDSVGDFVKSFKRIMLTAVAQIAAAMVFQPVIGGVTSALAGQAAVGAATGFGGIGAGISGIGTALNASSLGQSINGFGASTGIFSSGLGATAANSYVNAAGQVVSTTAAPLTSATLTSTLGAAGLGALGGTLLAGITGGNKTGGAIGGGLGAGIGFAVGGPLGGLIGGAGGSLLGGLLGSTKPSNKEQGVDLDLVTGLSSTFGQTGKKYSKENASAAQAISQVALQFKEELARGTGGTVGLDNIKIAVGSRDGATLDTGSGKERFNDDKALTAGLIEAITKSLTGAGANVTKLIDGNKLNFKDADQTQRALGLAATIDDLIKPTNDAKKAIDDLNRTYAENLRIAKELDLNTKALGDAQAAALKEQQDTVQAQIDAFTGANDSGAQLRLDIKAVTDQVDELAKAGIAAGADISKLNKAQNERINLLQREAAEQAKANRAAEEAARQAEIDAKRQDIGSLADQFISGAQGRITTLSGIADSLKFGQFSALSTRDQLTAANQDFGAIVKRAQKGDASAFGEIGGAADQYLTLNRQLYGSTSPAQQATKQVEKIIAQLEAQQKRQLAEAERDRKLANLQQETQTKLLGEQLTELKKMVRDLGNLKFAAKRA